jgi:septal ring factor EnvC (AmiA/AmiB activator)
MLAVPTATDHEMKRHINHLGLLLAMCIALCPGRVQSAEETVESARMKAKLAEVRGRIDALTNRLGGELRQRDALSARLREAELAITAKRRQLDTLRSAEEVALRRRAELRAEETHVQHELDAEHAALASQIRAAYMMGEQEQLKLLLNQTDAASAGRMAAYYGYFARERLRQIADIADQLGKRRELLRQIGETTAQLEALKADAARDMTDLQQARAERLAALADVTRRVSSGSQELAELKREAQAEEALLADLARVLQDYPIDAQQSFAELRGKLAWPVPGRMTSRYRDARTPSGETALRWNGVLIESTRGAKVRAPYFGRVIYADWLQGLGLLMIIGHTGNFMTLYGHAEVLYKAVGDWVAPGDVIAALGDSSGAPPQLYFEIRAGRTPEDPKLWLKTAP